jgi:hypothetical protein
MPLFSIPRPHRATPRRCGSDRLARVAYEDEAVGDREAQERSFPHDVPNRCNRPFAAFQGRPCERVGSARKRSSAEGGGCANSEDSLPPNPSFAHHPRRAPSESVLTESCKPQAVKRPQLGFRAPNFSHAELHSSAVGLTCRRRPAGRAGRVGRTQVGGRDAEISVRSALKLGRRKGRNERRRRWATRRGCQDGRGSGRKTGKSLLCLWGH